MCEIMSETHCKFFVTRKKRYCRIQPNPGDEFCGEHQKPQEISNETNEGKIRIVCPLDRKHTCYAHNLKKHLKICNARPVKAEVYIEKGVNSGRIETDVDDSYRLLSSFSTDDIKNVIRKVSQVYVDIVQGNISEKFLSHEIVEEELSKEEYGDKTKKHLKQASAILGLLKEFDLMKDDSCYIEFGAGRGQLSYWIMKATESILDCSALLVERASPKHKRDNKLSKGPEIVQRIRADISDLILDKVDIISKRKHIVGITKHLCGEATDLALRCLTNVNKNKEKISGAIMTFCCHHRCRWISYTGKKFFQEHNLSNEDFYVMCGMASWATCGSGFSRERRNKEVSLEEREIHNLRDSELNLNREQKAEIGLQCKGILNWGRLCYLEEMGFNCSLHFYVNKNVSLENVCIVARKKLIS